MFCQPRRQSSICDTKTRRKQESPQIDKTIHRESASMSVDAKREARQQGAGSKIPLSSL